MRSPAFVIVAIAIAAPAAAQDLPATIAAALAHAPALEEAGANEAVAKARLDRARAERNPLLRGEGSIGEGRIDNGGFFGIPAANVTQLVLQATAEMPLYTGGRVSAAMDQARGGAEIARLGANQARLQTTVQAVSAYAGVLTARKLEARYVQLNAALAETVRGARLRYHVGEIPSSEVALAEARQAEATAGLAQAQGRRLSAEAAYRRLTGTAPGTLAPLPALPTTPPTLEEALDQAQRANPVLAEAQAAVKLAEAGARAARAEAMPTLGAFAEASHLRDEFFPGYKADGVTVGLRGKWTLWSGGRVAASSRAADAEIGASQARLHAADQALEGMVIDAWQALITARRMREASQARQRAAAEALRGTKLEAKVGAKPTLAVLDAEREALEADTALLQADAAQTIAAWQLNALTGLVAI